MIGQTNQSKESLGSRSDLWKRVYVRARERWPTRASVRSFVIGKTNSRIENHQSLRGDLASDKWAIGARWHVARNCGDASRSLSTIYEHDLQDLRSPSSYQERKSPGGRHLYYR